MYCRVVQAQRASALAARGVIDAGSVPVPSGGAGRAVSGEAVPGEAAAALAVPGEAAAAEALPGEAAAAEALPGEAAAAAVRSGASLPVPSVETGLARGANPGLAGQHVRYNIYHFVVLCPKVWS